MLELWGEAVRSIEPMIKPAHREQWLRPVECLSISGERIVLRAPNRFHKQWFEDNYLPSILESLRERTKTAYTVDFQVMEVGAELEQRAAVSPVLPGPPSQPALPVPGLDPRYTFEKFVVGPTNQFAHAAARRVADTPGSRWNPLFIYGGVGLGKTHLLHAIGHEIRRLYPDYKIVSVTCERFVVEYIAAVMNNRRNGSSGISLMEEFRRRYREEPDVLLIDDIQFLSNKDSTQDEFFHTFNALHLAQKQIVVTCDKLPAELPGIEDRLKSRFTWGLITQVDMPDLETRVAILKRKAELEGTLLTDDVALFLGSHIKSNVREIEGALQRVTARASIENRPITRDLAAEMLKGYLSTQAPTLSVEAIQREVAAYFDVKLHDLKGPKRHRAIVHPRAVAMYLARRLTCMSYPEIGHRFGGKDHSTVISAVRKVERLSGQDAALRSVLQTLEGHLREA
jgi:chromosomal replication initiator protein